MEAGFDFQEHFLYRSKGTSKYGVRFAAPLNSNNSHTVLTDTLRLLWNVARY